MTAIANMRQFQNHASQLRLRSIGFGLKRTKGIDVLAGARNSSDRPNSPQNGGTVRLSSLVAETPSCRALAVWDLDRCSSFFSSSENLNSLQEVRGSLECTPCLNTPSALHRLASPYAATEDDAAEVGQPVNSIARGLCKRNRYGRREDQHRKVLWHR